VSLTYPEPLDPVIAPGQTWTSAGREVTDVAFGHQGGMRWWIAFAVSLALVGLLTGCVFWVMFEGVGVWGNNIPVTWALDIVGYDWWIGVASGGLMVSAMLLLLGAEWRGAVNRITETMALISAAAAGLYPIIHLGRPWFFYWNLPYPNTFLLWPQFRSPLYWDAIDIISFLGICLSFWYVGMLPDIAAMRDRAIEQVAQHGGRSSGWMRLLKAQLYGIAAMGWRGSVVHWQRWNHAYHTIAVFAVVLVMSLQTGAAVMFAGTAEPGWHDALSPIAFIFAALFAGVGVVAMLLVVLRTVFPLEPLVTLRHLNLVGMMLLGLGLANLYCYAAEFLTTVLTGSDYDRAVLAQRFEGAHAWSTWAIILCSLLPVHLFWLRPLRRSAAVLFVVGLLVAFGTWADHFMLIVITLQHDFLPSAAHPYAIDLVGVATFFGTVGLFLFLLLLFLRYLPVLSIVEMRRLIPALAARRG
jgi:Ni/Fe-hydrogenase subunit HybB-like protein